MTLITDQLRVAARRFPDEIGFTVAGVGDLTFAEWHTNSSRFARGLIAAGVEPGDRVALALTPRDGLRFVIAYAGTHKAGGVAVPVNVRMSAGEVTGLLRHSEPKVAVVSDSLRNLVDASVVPSLSTVVVAGQKPADDAGSPFEVVAWDDVPAGDDTDVQVPRESDDLAEILYTSGTTSTPKGVAIRHSNSALVVLSDPEWTGKSWLHASPMFTMAGLTFVYQSMRMGMRTLYLPRFDAGEWLRLVQAERPAATFLVPAMVELLMAHPDLGSTDLSSLEIVSVGSAPIAAATMLRLEELVPDALVTNSYSMTEAGTAYFVMPKGELRSRPGSVGKPLPPAEVRIVDDDEAEVDVGQVGNIEIKPAGRMREYYRNPEASAEVFTPAGWLRTGDLGKFDEDGYLYIVGRAKEVIIRGGFNVYATDVESVLYEHPAIREAAVVGVPHQVLGEDIAAFVVAVGDVTVDELTAHCAARLADYKVPRQIHIVGELPRNATGKVLKRDLLARLGD